MKIPTVTLVAMVFALAACDRKQEPDAAAAGPGAASTAAANASRASAGDAVAAVLQSAGAPVARLAFLLETSPVVGKPFSIKLLATAAEPVPALQLSVESSSLILAPPSGVLALGTAEIPVSYDLIATAQQEGLAELTVRLKAGEGAEAVYAIPLLVSGAATQPAPAGGG